MSIRIPAFSTLLLALTAPVVAPNPLNGSLLRFRVESPAEGSVTAQVYDVRGRVVARLDAQTVGQGMTPLTLSVSDLAAGAYLLRVEGPEASSRSIPFVLTR